MKPIDLRLASIGSLVLLLAARPAPAQPTWRQAFPPTPYGGLCSRFVHDQARGVLVLFDGDTAATWEWNGSAWSRRPTAVSPSPRSSFAMAYDPVRARTVLFGGSNAPLTALGDTWEWDGTTWTHLVPSVSPVAREGHAMAWDPVNAQVLLFGGNFPPVGWFSDTWLWNGQTWTIVAAAPFRWEHAMATDPVRRRVVVFGGWDPTGALVPQTMEWDGTAWTSQLPATGPLPRVNAALAWDGQRARTVLYGGTRTVAPDMQDTWEWDGTGWTQRASVGPENRSDHAMAWFPPLGRIVLFGGVFQFYRAHSDLWTWDGAAWLQVQAQARPPVSADHGLAYDAVRRRTVLYTAYGETWEWDGNVWTRFPITPSPGLVNRVALACRGRFTTLLGNQGDTWEWDGTVWSRVAPPNPSLARTGHGLVFDSRRRRTVLYGGSPLSDTWEWNGSTWTQVAVPGPPARYFHGMAYDSARGRVVAYGGQPQGGGNALAETWEWDGTTWTQLFPARSPGPRMGCAMAQRSPSGRVLLHAGALDGWGRSPLADTWEWDGTSWTQVVTAPSPGTRSFHAMTYDPDRRLALLYGGAIPPPPGSGPQMQVASDLWEFSDRFGPAGPGQPAGGALPITFTPPRIGTSFCVSFSDPPPTGAGFGILLVASGTPLQPPAVLNPPGVCVVAYLHLLPQAAFMVYGDPAVFCLPIPPNPALAGQLFTLQGAALEVGVCFRLTDALAGEILM